MPNHEPDLFELYFRYTQHTEPPKIFHRWSLISCISAMLGRKVYCNVGFLTIYPNQFVLLTGGPGVRKSTAINMAKDLARHAEYDTFAYSSTSGAKFLEDFAAGFSNKSKVDDALSATLFPDEGTESSQHSECWAATGEFNTFIGHGSVGFISSLTDLWDNPPVVDVRTKHSGDLKIVNPVVNILGGTTPTGISQALPPEIIGQGFLSRVILVYSSVRTKITWPPPPDTQLAVQIVERLHKMRTMMCGAFKITNEAKEYIDVVYRKTEPLEDARFENFHSRRFDHLIKLCMVVAASRLSMEITAADALYANSILSFTELDMPKALGHLGSSRGAEVANKVYTVLLNETAPLTLQEIFRRCSADFDKPQHVSDVVQTLVAAGKAKSEPHPSGVGHGIVAVRLERDLSREQFSDFDLLIEKHERTEHERSDSRYSLS